MSPRIPTNRVGGGISPEMGIPGREEVGGKLRAVLGFKLPRMGCQETDGG